MCIWNQLLNFDYFNFRIQVFVKDSTACRVAWEKRHLLRGKTNKRLNVNDSQIVKPFFSVFIRKTLNLNPPPDRRVTLLLNVENILEARFACITNRPPFFEKYFIECILLKEKNDVIKIELQLSVNFFPKQIKIHSFSYCLNRKNLFREKQRVQDNTYSVSLTYVSYLQLFTDDK